MQYILDAHKVEAHQVHPDPFDANEPFPDQIRKVGYVPHLDDLQPGDLILTAGQTKFDGVARGISFIQGQGGYLPEHAQWTHAAVYAGNLFLICQATRKGVGLGNLLDSLPNSKLRVRRGVAEGRYIDREMGWKIALFSMARLTQAYDFSHAAETGKLAAGKGFSGYRAESPKDLNRADEAICSELFQDAYWRATGVRLQHRLSLEVTPAFMSATPLLKDVECRCRKLSC